MECYARLIKTTLIFGTGLYSGILLAQSGGIGTVATPGAIIEKTSGTIKSLMPEPCPPKKQENGKNGNSKKSHTKREGGGKGDGSEIKDGNELQNGKEAKSCLCDTKPVEKPAFKECKCDETKQGAAGTTNAPSENSIKKPCKPKTTNADATSENSASKSSKPKATDTDAGPEKSSKKPCKPKATDTDASAESSSKKPCKPKKNDDPH